MNDFTCRECGKEFVNRKAFHHHLKVHNLTIGDYYVQYYAKRDLYTNDLLHFLNYNQYFSQDFNSFQNCVAWLKTTSPIKAKNYLYSKSKQKFKDKEISTAPANLYYTLAEMPNVDFYKKFWYSYSAFAKDVGVKSWFDQNMPEEFWTKDCQDIKIFIDTREKLPLSFYNSCVNKLDFGDYTAGGDFYSKTFIDRKSQDDFRQTFGKEIQRFRREMDRCVRFDSYMFVVVESSIAKIEEENKVSKFKSNLGYIWHNLRQLMIEYPENLQFVFAYSRSGAQKIIPKLLFYGQSMWHVDVQYHLEKKVHGVEQQIITLSK